jgi:CDP-diacylglycerol---glycerol-3-phosphate 3-phosphatidyltransferase
MKKRQLGPALISSLRIVALPFFYYCYLTQNTVGCLLLLVFCVATDHFDGFLARKLAVTSNFGGYFDATTDFIFTAGIFTLFTINGFYPIWLPLLIALSFTQFIVTSQFSKKLYDPIGRYIGSALYIGIALTLLLPVQVVFDFVQYAFVVFFLVSLASRIVSLRRKNV